MPIIFQNLQSFIPQVKCFHILHDMRDTETLEKKKKNLTTYSATQQIFEVSIEINKSLITTRVISCAVRLCQKKGRKGHSNGNAH